MPEFSLERRFFNTELRMEGQGEQRQIVGFGAMFNRLSEDLGGFREMILPEAFTDTLTDDVRGLFNHDPNLILGRTLAETMTLEETPEGLIYRITPPETSYAQDLIMSMERGDVNRSSFGFRVLEESWKHPTEDQPLPVRVLHKVRLYDTGPVTFPAYPETSAEVRSEARAKATEIINQSRTSWAWELSLKERQLQLAEKL